ncbi:MAG: 16S rRNA (cytosine(967)-C(5))-methyltransferase RsmB [Bacillaceae bacterium]|nr:16S rRNA (cytosine(967)-C(5))-methyltransferase RsmB [Bacillaceae bacterium]
MTPSSAREIAIDVLEKVEEHDSYSNLELNQAFQRVSLDHKEKSLATELVYGTLSRLNTLDWMIDQFVKQGTNRLDNWVKQLLRISFYQIYYLERIPDRATVHQAVEIAKKWGHKGIAGFVNGVLRSFLRQPEKVEIPSTYPLERRLSLQYSHPEWMIKRWLEVYGEETTRKMAEANNQPPLTSIRVNTLKASADEIRQYLADQYPEARIEASSLVPESLKVSGIGNVADTAPFREGKCTIQDESSMLVGKTLRPGPGMEVLDACAAPGGKTTHMAELMENRGKIVAADIHPHKKALIEEHASRLGITIIDTITADATNLASILEEKQFDRILLDAPCTGLGVIRRKPDLKWKKRESDVADIASVQYRMLEEISRLVRPGGVLVYSTCTVEPKENEQQVLRFVREHPEFLLDTETADILPVVLSEKYDLSRGYFQILPHHFESDGFFIARLKREA